MSPFIGRTVLGVLLPSTSSSSAALISDSLASVTACPQHLLSDLPGGEPRIDNRLFPLRTHEQAVTALPRIIRISVVIIPAGQLVNVLFTGPVQVTYELLTAAGVRLLVPDPSPICVGSEGGGDLILKGNEGDSFKDLTSPEKRCPSRPPSEIG